MRRWPAQRKFLRFGPATIAPQESPNLAQYRSRRAILRSRRARVSSWRDYQFESPRRSFPDVRLRGCERSAQRRFFTTALSMSRKRSPRRFESEIQRVGNRPARRSSNRKAGSMPSAMRTFWLRRAGWHSMKEFLSSRRARRRSPAFSSAATQTMPRTRSKKFGKPAGSFALLLDTD